MLEFEFFRCGLAYAQFYEKAKQAASLMNRDALEVFYLAVVMGFRGLYQDPTTPDALHAINTLDLPPNVEGWANKTAGAIRQGSQRPPLPGFAEPGYGAPPLESKAQLITYLLMGAVLVAANVGIGLMLWRPKASSQSAGPPAAAIGK